jgi:hypothetical protein
MCRGKSEIFRGAAEGLALSADGDKLRACNSIAVRAACVWDPLLSGLRPHLKRLRKPKTAKDDTPSGKWRGWSVRADSLENLTRGLLDCFHGLSQ